MEPLSKEIILAAMHKSYQEKIELELHQQLDSTNSHLLKQTPSEKICVCLAETQTMGRGRYGRSWLSPKGCSIYLSLAHLMNKEISKLSGFSLMVGIILAETLQTYCADQITVKWPNDLLVNEKKLSGILIEISTQNNGCCRVVTGIGVNVAMSVAQLDTIPQPAISLKQCNPVKRLSRNNIIADLLVNLLQAIDRFTKSGFAIFRTRWNERDLWLNQLVELQIGNKSISGIHRGVDKFGALLLEHQGKLSSWNSGEVSLRRVSSETTN